jgi:membrane-bound lytic murein transglycosylase B
MSFSARAVQGFIHHMVRAHHFPAAQLVALFHQARPLAGVLSMIHHPYEALPWRSYRRLFVNPEKIRNGQAWLLAHAHAIRQEERRFGVPGAIIAAILGVETDYGRVTGQIPALDSLSTLAFEDPGRGAFFRHELSGYLRLCRREHFNPTAIRGSYAGALGIPQFMPTAYLRYAIGRSPGRRANLFASMDDAINSVARYLLAKGWQPGQPVAIEVALAPDRPPPPPGLIETPTHVRALRRAGFLIPHRLSNQLTVELVTRPGLASTHYWLTLHNFQSLMAYNPSVNYTMAVFELALRLSEPS